ncbi:MAG: hypothetical protein ACREMQ_19290 [Longimicrobiales bacterium]
MVRRRSAFGTRWLRGFIFASCAAGTACISPTDTAPRGRDVRGTWRYTAVQGAPAATLMGNLVLSEQSGSSFSGRLDVQETDAVGVQRARAGAAAGRALDDASVDFDAFLDATPRRHVARVSGDTMSGTWFQPAEGTTFAGTFRAVRVESR